MNGPAKYYIRIAKNHSYNTICSAVLIDRLTGLKHPSEDLVLCWMGDLRYDPPSPEPAQCASAPNPPEDPSRLESACDLWSATTLACERQTGTALQWPCRLMAYRAARAEGAPANLLGNWRWNLLLWSEVDREEFRRVMALAWHNVQKNNPELRTKEYRKYSPNTYATAEEWERRHLPSASNGKEQPRNQ